MRLALARRHYSHSWIPQQFGCLALTIELLFKDNTDLPDPLVGWSDERFKKLGAFVLQPSLR